MTLTTSLHRSVYALAWNILAVATTRPEGGWVAFVAPVPGENHDEEMQIVLNRGTKLDADVARVLFPHLAAIRYAGE